jgi:transposase
MSKHKSDDYKLLAVEYYLNTQDISLIDTCKIFKCSKTSLDRWVERYLVTGNVSNKKRKEGSYKITKTHVKFIKDLIKQKPEIFLWQILEQLNEKHKIKISKSHLVNIIKYLNLTYKKFYENHNPKTRYGKEINYKESFKNFFDKIKKYKLEDLISIDETSVQVGVGFNKGRFLMGKRLYKNTTSNEIFKKYTLVVAINNKKTVKADLYKKGGIDTIRLIKFLKELLKNKKDKLIILDNASAHRNDTIKKFIKNSGNDYLHILPYKHFLNPIEAYFNQLKYYIKQKQPMNYEKIKESVEYGIKNIKKKNYENYFYNAYDKKKLKTKLEKSNRLHKKSKIYKD